METLEVFREKEKKKNRNCEEMEWNHSGFGVTPRDGGGGTYKSIEREKEKKKTFFIIWKLATVSVGSTA